MRIQDEMGGNSVMVESAGDDVIRVVINEDTEIEVEMMISHDEADRFKKLLEMAKTLEE